MSQETPRITVTDAHANTRPVLYGSALSLRCQSYAIRHIKRMTHTHLPDFCFLIVFDLLAHSGKRYVHVIQLKPNNVYSELRIRCVSCSNEPISPYRRYRIMEPEAYTSEEQLYEWEYRGECDESGLRRAY